MDKPDCYKEKPHRPSKEHKFSVCDCGHYWHEHDGRGFTGYMKACWLFIFTFGRYGGSCDRCVCNTYHKMGKYTYAEKNALRPCTDNNESKDTNNGLPKGF